MIRTGTARFWDMYWRPVAVARAVRDAGMRATIGPPLLDGLDPSRSKAACDEAARLLDELVDHEPWVQASLAPHGIYTASEPTLAWVAEESARRGVPVHLHFLETEDEVTGCVERTGERPAAYLQRLGLLSSRLLLAHGVWMDEPELELVGSSGATVVTDPVSNLKLAVGRAFPYAAVRDHGIAVGLGTDGASSNNSLDLIADVKVFALLQKFTVNDPAALSASEAWQVATGALAPALDGTPTLAVGERADFLLVDADAPALTPGHVLDNLVYAASGAVVRTTVVGGDVLMRDRVVVGTDGVHEDEVRARAVECARRLGVL
jgi:5-methylthioadenosine/S-adenosylhomocysteine deaminase